MGGEIDMSKKEEKCLSLCSSRREFLLLSGAATATIFLTGIPGLGAAKVEAVVTKYPRQKIGTLSSLKVDAPVNFQYPDKGKFSNSILVKLGTAGGGGVGPQNDVVAFNLFCTHMGGDLKKGYKAGDKVLGPCPYHLSTFDLTRHGMIVSGHATESLPQVQLELEGDTIYAAGIMGLIYGRNSNI
jgi:arsenite oxidase small subunit